MKKYRYSLPPLDTLIFFEAAMRYGSFTRAADELMVSQAAVSKRIRQLEDWLDIPLFSRNRHKLQPTPLANILGERVSTTLDFLETSIEKLRLPQDPVVQIGAMTVIGMFWLQPRLQNFALSETASSFSLTLSDNISQLLKSHADLLIIYGDGNFPGWHAHLLMKEELVPVASPPLAKQLQENKSKMPVPLLEYRRHAPDWVNWSQWRQKCVVDFTQNPHIQPCASYTQTIGLALEGKGIALGNLPILENEIKQGRLVRLGQQGLMTGRAYWVAQREGFVSTPATKAIFTALKQAR